MGVPGLVMIAWHTNERAPSRPPAVHSRSRSSLQATKTLSPSAAIETSHAPWPVGLLATTGFAKFGPRHGSSRPRRAARGWERHLEPRDVHVVPRHGDARRADRGRPRRLEGDLRGELGAGGADPLEHDPGADSLKATNVALPSDAMPRPRRRSRAPSRASWPRRAWGCADRRRPSPPPQEGAEGGGEYEGDAGEERHPCPGVGAGSWRQSARAAPCRDLAGPCRFVAPGNAGELAVRRGSWSPVDDGRALEAPRPSGGGPAQLVGMACPAANTPLGSTRARTARRRRNVGAVKASRGSAGPSAKFRQAAGAAHGAIAARMWPSCS